MKRIKAWLRAFFGLSRKEQNGFLVLVPLLIVIILGVPLYQQWLTTRPTHYKQDIKTLDSLATVWSEASPTDSIYIEPKPLFAFNPNTATVEQLTGLGLPVYVAKRILNYRSKGGKFTIKNDFKKMYGLDSTLYTTLYPYIDLPDQISKNKIEKIVAETKTYSPKDKERAKFDINQADTTMLKSIYGIGTKLSARIVSYRNKLGGFIQMDQLREVYGLDSTAMKELQKKSFLDKAFAPVTININMASEKEMAGHPYISYALAKAIAAYRFQHGQFATVDDLKKIAILKEEDFTKIKPYISTNE